MVLTVARMRHRQIKAPSDSPTPSSDSAGLSKAYCTYGLFIYLFIYGVFHEALSY
jgi:hypothetical protein